MITSTPSPIPIAIIGGGFGGLMTFTVLRFHGVLAKDIHILSVDTSPELSWAHFVRQINQKTLRSESIAHFFPTDSPGLATLEALYTWSIKPLIQSWFDRYRPTVEFMINHIQKIASSTGYYSSLKKCRVSRIEKKDTHFEIYNQHDQLVTKAHHVILAVGHGALSIPPVIEEYKKQHPDDAHVGHVFTDGLKLPRMNKTLVIGSGLTGGTEWFNVLSHGGSVVAVCHEGFDLGQALNTPRRYFSSRGINPYVAQTPAERIRELKKATHGTVPKYPHWMHLFKKAYADGRLTFITGSVEHIMRHGSTLRCLIREPDQHTIRLVEAETVLAATGFKPATSHPLIKTLIDTYHLPLHGPYLALDNTCQIEALNTSHSTLSVIGPAAIWAIPCADSIGGIKIAAHRIAEAILGHEQWHIKKMLQNSITWGRLVLGKEI